MTTETQRRNSNKDKVLRLLERTGKNGATNMQLAMMCGLRYGARIFELRREGYDIETVAGQGGSFRFILKGRRVEQQRLFA